MLHEIPKGVVKPNPENERMMQDHIRLCGALGVDADAHIDMLAEAAERLRAEKERLHEQVSSHAGWLWCCREDLKCAEKRIAELTAALREIEFTARTGVMAGTERGPDPLHMTKDEVITYCFDTAGAALEEVDDGQHSGNLQESTCGYEGRTPRPSRRERAAEAQVG